MKRKGTRKGMIERERPQVQKLPRVLVSERGTETGQHIHTHTHKRTFAKTQGVVCLSACVQTSGHVEDVWWTTGEGGEGRRQGRQPHDNSEEDDDQDADREEPASAAEAQHEMKCRLLPPTN